MYRTHGTVPFSIKHPGRSFKVRRLSPNCKDQPHVRGSKAGAQGQIQWLCITPKCMQNFQRREEDRKGGSLLILNFLCAKTKLVVLWWYEAILTLAGDGLLKMFLGAFLRSLLPVASPAAP